MAILMRPGGASSNDISPIVPPTPLNMASDHLSAVQMSSAPPEEDFTLARERKHACSMCHKRFDRPSTLRKYIREKKLSNVRLVADDSAWHQI
ncbi:c2h2 conidiation transcription factor [Lentinula edodes]|uniref:C2h2 conidiation transcription factor n=1 Tax=Lentinula edodes TaxID=5353 RepID=A0A1Q3ECQ1_LENED|nr:c2h2 conidiation transcription factor [Lentinula edodes]